MKFVGNKISLTSLLLLALMVTACGQGFQPSQSLKAKLSSCVNCSVNPGPTPDPWSKVDLDGSVSAGIFGTHKVIDLDKVNNLLIIRIPLPVDPFNGGAIGVPIPQVPGAEIGQETDPATGKSYLVVKIPLQYVVRGVQLADPGRLPNGKPLPGVPGGELPEIGLHIANSKVDLNLYLGKGAVGVFVPTPGFNPYLDLTFPIRNKSQRKLLGYFASVAEVSPYAGGFFLSVVLPDEIQRAIDDIIP